MHLLKTVIYSRLTAMTAAGFVTGLCMGGAMIAGTFAANRFIRRIEKNKFQKYVAVLLCAVGVYMLIFGA